MMLLPRTSATARLILPRCACVRGFANDSDSSSASGEHKVKKRMWKGGAKPTPEMKHKREARQAINFLLQDPSVIKARMGEASLPKFIQGVAKYEAIPPTVMKDVESVLVLNAPVYDSNILLEAIIMYAVIAHEVPKPLLYHMSTKVTFLHRKDIVRFVYFAPLLSKAAVAELKELGAIKDAFRLIEEELTDMDADELYMSALGCTRLECDGDLTRRVLTVAVEKITLFSPTQLASLFLMLNGNKKSPLPGRKVPEPLVTQAAAGMKFVDLLLLLQACVESGSGPELRQKLEAEVAARVCEAADHEEVCHAVRLFQRVTEMRLKELLAKGVDKYMRDNIGGMNEKQLMDVVGCLEKHNGAKAGDGKKRYYTKTIVETLLPIVQAESSHSKTADKTGGKV